MLPQRGPNTRLARIGMVALEFKTYYLTKACLPCEVTLVLVLLQGPVTCKNTMVDPGASEAPRVDSTNKKFRL